MKVLTTEPPSWDVVVVNEDQKEDSPLYVMARLTLDPADDARDRIDLICLHEQEIIAVKGPVANGIAALNPDMPELPSGAKVIAQVDIRGASKFLDAIAVTNFAPGTLQTGERPALPAIQDGLYLDPHDPFDSILIPLVHLNRAKRADYANPANLFANFDKNAAMVNLPGYTPLVDCLSMITRKIGRIVNLRGRKPTNETVVDSWQDLVVYTVLGCGLAIREANFVRERELNAAANDSDS